MHGLKMINTRAVEVSKSSKRTTTKEMVHAIEMALVQFKLIDEEQVTEMELVFIYFFIEKCYNYINVLLIGKEGFFDERLFFMRHTFSYK